MVFCQRRRSRDGKHISSQEGKRKEVLCSCDVVFVPTQPSGSEGQTGDIHEERERLRLVLKQMGRIKCPTEVCNPSFLAVTFPFPLLHS